MDTTIRRLGIGWRGSGIGPEPRGEEDGRGCGGSWPRVWGVLDDISHLFPQLPPPSPPSSTTPSVHPPPLSHRAPTTLLAATAAPVEAEQDTGVRVRIASLRSRRLIALSLACPAQVFIFLSADRPARKRIRTGPPSTSQRTPPSRLSLSLSLPSRPRPRLTSSPSDGGGNDEHSH